MAVAGVMGGFESEVEASTVSLFIESAYFNPSNIRKTSRALNLVSESSQRFQRGADPELARYAADRCCQLILETGGGTLAKGAIDEYPETVHFPRLTLRYGRANHLLGADVPPETQRKALQEIGFVIHAGQTDDDCLVDVPSWRSDVSCEADLIEEIGRCYGYDRIPETIPAIAARDERLAPEYYAARALRNFLSTIGLSEVVTWSFGSDQEVRQAGLNGRALQSLKLANPLTENHATMRTTLIPALLRTASNAVRKGAGEVKLYEIAPVYFAPDNGTHPVQELRLAIAMAGQAEPAHWQGEAQAVDFYDIKGYVETVLDRSGLTAEFAQTTSKALQPGQGATVLLNGEEIGLIGRVSAASAAAYDIDVPVYIAEIALEPVILRQRDPIQYEPISTYPPSRRDLAVTVASDTDAGPLRDAALKAGGNLLKSVQIFDVFTGAQVGEGRKSVALSLEFQAMDRTLTDQDTQKAFDKIVKRLSADFGAELR